jgi:serine/threonine-protein kinase
MKGRGLSFSANTPQRIGRYRILRRLASGGLAEVYLGIQEGPDGFVKPVAIKRLHSHFAENSTFINMLADEARVTARLDHPHIAQVLEFNYDEASGEGFLVYEFVPGRTLSQLLRQDERGLKGARGERFALSEAEAVALTIGAARALHYAAERIDKSGEKLGVVHRDLSPPNMMVSFNGMVKVIDFGIAQAKHRIEQTETGVVKGKFRYMSPEQLRGEALDHRSDLYSLGVVLFELLNGEPLFSADDDLGLMAKVQAAVLPDFNMVLPETSADLRDILSHLLQRQSIDRIASGAELAQRLQQLLVTSHGVFDPEEPLRNMMERRFPGAGAALEQELSLSEAPDEAEGVRRLRNLGANPTDFGGVTATMASLPDSPFSPPSEEGAFTEQPTLISRTFENSIDDEEGLITDHIKRPRLLKGGLVMVTLFASIAYATFLGVRAFKPVNKATVASSQPIEKVPLRIVCPGEASVVLKQGDKEILRQSCPFAEVLPLGLYSARIQRPGYEPRLLQFNLKAPLRYPDQGSLPMQRITGQMLLLIKPEGVKPKVLIDDKPWVEGELIFPGEHKVVVSAQGYVTQQFTVQIKGNDSLEKHLVLTRPQFGFLRVLPPKRGWFDVLHKGKKLCAVPPTCGRLRLPVGAQTLELRSVGPIQRRRVVIRADKLTLIDLSK